MWNGSSLAEIRQYYLANGQKIAQRLTQGGSETLSYLHTDHLGSSVKMTDETGQVIQTMAYAPYGETALTEGSQAPAYQYTGQEKDAATSLYYYGARYYDPDLGRFIQADPLLDGLNRYAYTHNNPLKYVDPTGNYDVAPDTGECFGGDCDHYPGYKDFDPKTITGEDDEDVRIFMEVTSNILGGGNVTEHPGGFGFDRRFDITLNENLDLTIEYFYSAEYRDGLFHFNLAASILPIPKYSVAQIHSGFLIIEAGESPRSYAKLR